jgi:hypothetical protein
MEQAKKEFNALNKKIAELKKVSESPRGGKTRQFGASARRRCFAAVAAAATAVGSAAEFR